MGTRWSNICQEPDSYKKFSYGIKRKYDSRFESIAQNTISYKEPIKNIVEQNYINEETKKSNFS